MFQRDLFFSTHAEFTIEYHKSIYRLETFSFLYHDFFIHIFSWWLPELAIESLNYRKHQITSVEKDLDKICSYVHRKMMTSMPSNHNIIEKSWMSCLQIFASYVVHGLTFDQFSFSTYKLLNRNWLSHKTSNLRENIKAKPLELNYRTKEQQKRWRILEKQVHIYV